MAIYSTSSPGCQAFGTFQVVSHSSLKYEYYVSGRSMEQTWIVPVWKWQCWERDESGRRKEWWTDLRHRAPEANCSWSTRVAIFRSSHVLLREMWSWRSLFTSLSLAPVHRILVWRPFGISKSEGTARSSTVWINGLWANSSGSVHWVSRLICMIFDPFNLDNSIIFLSSSLRCESRMSDENATSNSTLNERSYLTSSRAHWIHSTAEIIFSLVSDLILIREHWSTDELFH